MGILDEAIREHLDLKRKHGARDSEISEIEDEALGSGEQPDPFTAGELFGQVSEEPTALVEPPTPPPESLSAEPADEPSFPEPPAAEPAPPEPSAAPEPQADPESLEDLLTEEPGPPAAADPAVPPPPPPETAPPSRPEPSSPPAATEGQRGRALGRADLPTQEHLPPPEETGDEPSVPSESEPPETGDSQPYDFETDPSLEGVGTDAGAAPAPSEESDDFEALGPVEEADVAEEGDEGLFDEEGEEEDYRTEVRPADRDENDEDDDEDLLSESPEFLDQDTDESLWFEKGPPKDFDFEDEE